MGICTSKPQAELNPYAARDDNEQAHSFQNPNKSDPSPLNLKSPVAQSTFFSFCSPSPIKSPTAAASTPHRLFKMPFPPPSPAKHIRAVLARRQGNNKAAATATIREVGEEAAGGLDKRFGFSRDLTSRLEIGEEVGRGHFGYTCSAKFKKGELKGQQVAVKVIPKSKGIVHRDLKPENFLYTSNDENSQLKAIDFGLSDFVRPDEKLDDIVGSAYYVAPEVLRRSYSTEADVWSIGVIAYILLCGSRPFWARTESGIFRAVLKAEPSFNELPWLSVSSEAKDFVKRLLYKDPRRRMSVSQALSHIWIRGHLGTKIPLDILIFRLMKAYMRSSSLRKAALRALAKTLTADELFFLKEQFALLEPNKGGTITLENIRMALMKDATDAMEESHVSDFLASLNALWYRRMDFEEFCAAALSVHQMEALNRWEQHARCAYEIFEKDGNRAIMIDELAPELGLGPSLPVHVVLHDWIRHSDGKLSFLGFIKLLHGVSSRSAPKLQ